MKNKYCKYFEDCKNTYEVLSVFNGLADIAKQKGEVEDLHAASDQAYRKLRLKQSEEWEKDPCFLNIYSGL